MSNLAENTQCQFAKFMAYWKERFARGLAVKVSQLGQGAWLLGKRSWCPANCTAVMKEAQ